MKLGITVGALFLIDGLKEGVLERKVVGFAVGLTLGVSAGLVVGLIEVVVVGTAVLLIDGVVVGLRGEIDFFEVGVIVGLIDCLVMATTGIAERILVEVEVGTGIDFASSEYFEETKSFNFLLTSWETM